MEGLFKKYQQSGKCSTPVIVSESSSLCGNAARFDTDADNFLQKLG